MLHLPMATAVPLNSRAQGADLDRKPKFGAAAGSHRRPNRSDPPHRNPNKDPAMAAKKKATKKKAKKATKKKAKK
ncbi:MAG: hypothetical protein JNK49_02780 [Planctomycetes bacterium]|nr:hypothetical protein [Planctomycetota bacterium]